jgi:hypothetical protein
MLQQFLGRASVAATDDQRTLGTGVRERRDVHEVLVIEELVALGRHEVAVEPEQLAEGHAVVHLDRLVVGAEVRDRSGRTNEQTPIVRQVLGHHAGREIARRDRVIRHA